MNGFPIERLADLAAPFDPRDIHWRAQTISQRDGKYNALALAYIDARNVMERLDTVCGAANWQDRYEETPKGRVLCTLSLNIEGYWVNKSDGAGDTDVEGDKGAVSDALKRAGVKWGIGRYLYGLCNTWAECTVAMKGGEPVKTKQGNFIFRDWTQEGRKKLDAALAALGGSVSDDQRDIITGLAQAAGLPLIKICEGYGIKDLRELPATQFGPATRRLTKIINEASQQKKAA